jgi:hypothetical protein
MEHAILAIFCLAAGAVACYVIMKSKIIKKAEERAGMIEDRAKSILNAVEVMGETGYEHVRDNARKLKEKMGMD